MGTGIVVILLMLVVGTPRPMEPLHEPELWPFFTISAMQPPTRESDGYRGPVRSVFVSEALLHVKAGKEVEGVREPRGYKFYAGNGALMKLGWYDPSRSSIDAWTLTYGTRGNLLRAVSRDADGEIRMRKWFTYDKAGRLLRSEASTWPERTVHHTYDQRGRWTGCTIREDGRVVSTFRRKYSKSGVLLKEINESDNGKKVTVYTREGVLRKETVYDAAGRRNIVKSFDKKGRKVKETWYFPDGDVELAERWTYSEDGRKEEKAVLDGRGQLSHRAVFVLDESAKEIDRKLYDQDGKLEYHRTWTRDEHGNITKDTWWDAYGHHCWWTYEYAYDAYGNWTMRKEPYKGVVYRSFSYYPENETDESQQ